MFQRFDVTTRPDAAAPRVARLREWMEREGLDAFLVPRADRFQGEYVAPSDERLAWISGFTGSAGFAAILRERAAIFTDGRYTLQVAAQTDPATFETVSWPATKLADWLTEAMPNGGRVGFDPWLHTVTEIEGLSKTDGLEAVECDNGVDAIWTDRPPAPAEPMVVYPRELAGRAHSEKRAEIAEKLDGADAFLTTQPDAVCWLLNIRGADIPRTPVAHAMALLHSDATVDLICHPGQAETVADHLGPDVRVVAPDRLADLLSDLGPTGIDPATCPQAIHTLLQDPVRMDDPIALPKARKSPAEIAATREAHLRDATAMVRFLRWIDEERPHDATEIDVVTALEGFRRATNMLRDISFETIAGAGPNGAIVHYRVTTETNRPLGQDTLLLIDSGGQYEDGTTDITRTIPIGAPPEGAVADFTRVLQGMIAISHTRFPKGVAGAHLDALARAPLWAEHKDYDHGTGHGVGVYLGVHEGPARISRLSNIPLEPGMILSNEPGYYRTGAYGIRIENLIVVEQAEPLPGGDAREMFAFSTLTWVPIDRRLIDTSILSPAERTWLDDYHATVLERVGPRLDGEDLRWLKAACAPL
ncbi:aminopeptidase P family protein [Jannaschia aquimarina]|uniref:PepQ protein n=1 Tax=Jannaschia aquimarina TaxID=935700 RepID=A0A0D1CTB4_9RHOB|nr:aminopeptidase P family protein [Jannaschia aquimarina]KIT18012.1 Xaa-Pro dipeptidase [Jannaschia aquimarina]SNS88526.1 Xaa-Pro aminopeptidase [Jannaschia aquimarina]